MKTDQLTTLTDRLLTELHKQMQLADELIVLIQAYQDDLLKVLEQIHE